MCQNFNYDGSLLNKKVLLRERKRHTDRGVSSTTRDGVPPPPRPGLTGGGETHCIKPEGAEAPDCMKNTLAFIQKADPVVQFSFEFRLPLEENVLLNGNSSHLYSFKMSILYFLLHLPDEFLTNTLATFTTGVEVRRVPLADLGGREERPKISSFSCNFGNIWPNNRFLPPSRVGASWEILDPPLGTKADAKAQRVRRVQRMRRTQRANRVQR